MQIKSRKITITRVQATVVSYLYIHEFFAPSNIYFLVIFYASNIINHTFLSSVTVQLFKQSHQTEKKNSSTNIYFYGKKKHGI